MGIGKLAENGEWAVNGTPIYIPSSVEIDHDNMVSSDSGRMESGEMHITWIRSDIAKVNTTYKYLTGNEVNWLLSMMQGKEFTYTFPDNGLKSIRAYTGKCSYSQYTLSKYTEEGGLYKDFKINVIEM